MPSERILLGPGPSMVPPEVTAALTEPMVGHMDPDLFPILDEIVGLLRHVFQTENELAFPLSATGTGAMEAMLRHLVKPGDRLAVCTAGFFADRLADIGRRIGADVIRVEAPWGEAIAAVAVAHVETSTGVLQPLLDLVRVAHQYDAVVLVDAVASLGGVDLPVDRWEIDACYSGSQKCLSAPPGLAPVTVHARTRGRHTPATLYSNDPSGRCARSCRAANQDHPAISIPCLRSRRPRTLASSTPSGINTVVTVGALAG